MKWVLLIGSIVGLGATLAGGYIYYSDQGIPVEGGTLNGWEWKVRIKPEGYCAYVKRPGFSWQLVSCQETRNAAKGVALELIYGNTEGNGNALPPAQAEPREAVLSRRTQLVPPLAPIQAVVFGP